MDYLYGHFLNRLLAQRLLKKGCAFLPGLAKKAEPIFCLLKELFPWDFAGLLWSLCGLF
jgi:hypothetical protein